jgi:hypothetical protein
MRVCLAVALNVLGFAGVAAAQTVYVRNAPAGAAVEVVMNTTTAGSGTAGAAGDVKIPVTLFQKADTRETDVLVFVDTCAESRRIVLAERAAAVAPVQDGCERTQITGIYLVRRSTSLVVDLSGQTPTLLLVQGSYSFEPAGPSRFWPAPPTGLVLFGAAGLGKFRDAALLACGTLSDCSGGGWGGTFAAGATYWISPYIGIEGAFVRPSKSEIEGSGDRFRFTSALDAQMITIAGKVGVPARSVRFYGQFGANYHQAVFSTSQTMDDLTVTTETATETIPGGTQALELETAGWGWIYGGGIEVWATRPLGFYAELSRSALKGSPADDEEGTMSDAQTSFLLGVRLRIGR